MSFLEKYDDIDSSSDKKYKFQDGIYKVLLEKVNLDLENKYGPTASLMLRHKNNSVSWINCKIIDGSPFVLKTVAVAMGFEGQLREAIVQDDGNAKAVVESFSKLVTPNVGKYYSCTFKTGAKGYQNIFLNSETTRSDFESYLMPKMITEAVIEDAFGAPPSIGKTEEIPF